MAAEACPLVSVVTPCLNQARYLPETIASIQAQAYSPPEQRVVDGGPTDGTWELLQGLGDRVHALSAPGSNQSRALSLGFRAARGEVFRWLNGDDLYEPGAVAADRLRLPAGDHEFVHILPGLRLRPGVYRWRVSLYADWELLDNWYAVADLSIATESLGHPRDERAGILNLASQFRGRPAG